MNGIVFFFIKVFSDFAMKHDSPGSVCTRGKKLFKSESKDSDKNKETVTVTSSGHLQLQRET